MKSLYTVERQRGRPWQRRRDRQLRENPLCAKHYERGMYVQATQVDHIVALINGGADTDDNLQSLCHECHAEKTRRDLGQRAKLVIGTDGYPVDTGDI